MTARRRIRSTAHNWSVRIACGIPAGLVAFIVTRELYPVLNRGKVSLWGPILSALIVQVWSTMLIAQSILGWWPDADAKDETRWLTTRTRIGGVLGGIAAVVLTAALIAFVGGHQPDF